jgi:hypothetical protein
MHGEKIRSVRQSVGEIFGRFAANPGDVTCKSMNAAQPSTNDLATHR